MAGIGIQLSWLCDHMTNANLLTIDMVVTKGLVAVNLLANLSITDGNKANLSITEDENILELIIHMRSLGSCC